jgi:hypothetical protein
MRSRDVLEPGVDGVGDEAAVVVDADPLADFQREVLVLSEEAMVAGPSRAAEVVAFGAVGRDVGALGGVVVAVGGPVAAFVVEGPVLLPAREFVGSGGWLGEVALDLV